MERPRYVMHDGEPVPGPATGEPLADSEPVLRGIDDLAGSRLAAQLLGL